jgi:hypothetical protein
LVNWALDRNPWGSDPLLDAWQAGLLLDNLEWVAEDLMPTLGAAMIPVGGGVTRIGKAVNLPAAGRVVVNMEHVASGHMAGGARVSALKTLFPSFMGRTQVRRAILEAYRAGGKLGSQGERVLIQGYSSRYGLRIQMWLNRAAYSGPS